MVNLSEFCTCNNLECPLHPSKHNRGCAPCISKNLKLKEIPNCFFNLIEVSRNRGGDSLKEFYAYVITSIHFTVPVDFLTGIEKRVIQFISS